MLFTEDRMFLSRCTPAQEALWSSDINGEVSMIHEKMLNQVQDREVLSTIAPSERDSVLSKCRKVILPRNSPTVDLVGCTRASPSGPDLKIDNDSLHLHHLGFEREEEKPSISTVSPKEPVEHKLCVIALYVLLASVLQYRLSFY
ncbi:hypothetical protein KP509_02G031500 [Ceratopteris richardii]|uniref:Uncharacterized protein n=1 Tax=Ceratopteris richardii TaxID=49495 RepID=A0A8T2V4I8_CERRI|nr:hypothetical protein KP509_02G031500 [Ceratopteris richardii]